MRKKIYARITQKNEITTRTEIKTPWRAEFIARSSDDYILTHVETPILQ